MGVPGDDVHQAAPLVGGQRFARSSLFYERQGGFQFGCILLEALVIEGVALCQVLAQSSCGPLAKAGALL